MANSFGKPLHKVSIGVVIFFSIILSYFSFLLLALRFYHGREPLKKYIKTYPKLSKSSLLPYFYLFYLLYKKLIYLFDSYVGVYRGVSGSSSQIFVFFVLNMLSFSCYVFLSLFLINKFIYLFIVPTSPKSMM